jgi:hypothetical protein
VRSATPERLRELTREPRRLARVLGPALVAQQVADVLRAVPAAIRPEPEPRARDRADALLRQAFPNGLGPLG